MRPDCPPVRGARAPAADWLLPCSGAFCAKKTRNLPECILMMIMKRPLSIAILPFLFFALVCFARTYQLTNDPSVPEASGKLEVSHDHNGNTKLHLTVDHLANQQI